MTAIRSTKTAHTEDIAVKPAFRGWRAIVAAAAVIAFGLLAAPLQAEHETFSATVTLTATVEAYEGGEQVTLTGSVVNATLDDPLQQTGFLFRERQEGDGGWGEGDWQPIGDVNQSSFNLTVVIEDFLGSGPFYYQARAWNARAVDGHVHFSYSEPSDVVTVNRIASGE